MSIIFMILHRNICQICKPLRTLHSFIVKIGIIIIKCLALELLPEQKKLLSDTFNNLFFSLRSVCGKNAVNGVLFYPEEISNEIELKM